MSDRAPSLIVTTTVELAANRVAIGGDGDVVAASGTDFSTIDRDGVIRALPPAPLRPASPLSVAGDGAVIAAPAWFDPATGSWIAGVDSARPGVVDRLSAAAWTPDRSVLVTSVDGAHGSTIEVRRANAVRQVERDSHWALVASLVCDDQRCYGASVRLESWSLATGRRLWVTDDGRWQITAMALIGPPDERRIVTGRADGGVEQTDARSGLRLAETQVDGPVVTVRALGSGFVSADQTGAVTFHDDARSSRVLHRFDAPIADIDVSAAAFVAALDAWPPVVHVGRLDMG